jgi:hypothetical protein
MSVEESSALCGACCQSSVRFNCKSIQLVSDKISCHRELGLLYGYYVWHSPFSEIHLITQCFKSWLFSGLQVIGCNFCVCC